MSQKDSAIVAFSVPSPSSIHGLMGAELDLYRTAVCVAPVAAGQIMSEPQIAALDPITTIDDDDLGARRVQDIMFRLAETPGGIRLSGRGLGQDNDEVCA